jgi:ankyrin repeat protein
MAKLIQGIEELALAYQAKVEAKANNGLPPFQAAAHQSHKDVAALRLANQAEAEAKDTAGHTPLQIAADNGRTEVVELLRQNGGDN